MFLTYVEKISQRREGGSSWRWKWLLKRHPCQRIREKKTEQQIKPTWSHQKQQTICVEYQARLRLKYWNTNKSQKSTKADHSGRQGIESLREGVSALALLPKSATEWMLFFQKAPIVSTPSLPRPSRQLFK